MSICAHVYLWVWACLHVSDWQSEVNLGCLPLLLSLSFSFKTGPFSNWMLAVQAGSPVSSWDLPDSTYQCWGHWHLWPCLVSIWVLGIETQVFMLVQQVCLPTEPSLQLHILFLSQESYKVRMARGPWKGPWGSQKICGEQPESLEGIRGEQP